ncbi:MAG: tetratricopeptide repeat protein [Rhodocyclaceae bacterium]|nr:tetratricopeptide repeat protein [Rhodocyclaceae bacterium]MCB1963816.1 tetratricopeptide repeat protein [Rhodocyclaceae bacterium]
MTSASFTAALWQRPARTLAVLAALAVSAPLHAALMPSPSVIPDALSANPGNPLTAAYGALQAGRYAEAEATFIGHLATHPDDPMAMLGLSALAQTQNDAQGARTWMNKALERAPQNPALIHANGRLAQAQERWQDAISSLEQAVHLAPQAAGPRSDLAALLLKLGRAPEAIAHFQTLADAAPDDLTRRSHLGIAHVAAGHDADGVKYLESAQNGHDDDAMALSALALAYQRLGDHPRALRTSDRLIAANAGHASAWLIRGDALIALQRGDEAVDAYTRAEALAPSPVAALKRGSALERLGRNDDAEAAYRAALALDPRFGPAHNNLAFLIASQPERHDEALTAARLAVTIDNSRAAYHDTLGWVHQQRGDTELARAAYQHALALDANHPAAQRHLAALGTTPTPPAAQAAAPAPHAENAAPAPGAETAAAALHQRFDAWRSAWENKQVDDYLALYGATFSPPHGMTRRAWEADRHKKLGKKGRIEVTISQLVSSIDGDTATLNFRQRYASSNYADVSQKTLEWRRDNGVWQIVGEASTRID